WLQGESPRSSRGPHWGVMSSIPAAQLARILPLRALQWATRSNARAQSWSNRPALLGAAVCVCVCVSVWLWVCLCVSVCVCGVCGVVLCVGGVLCVVCVLWGGGGVIWLTFAYGPTHTTSFQHLFV